MSADPDVPNIDPLASILARHEQDMVTFKGQYLQAEEAYYSHTDGVVYEDLEPPEKSVYTRRLNELTRSRDESLKKVKDARSRLETTKSLLDLDGGTITGSSRSPQSVRIPALPSFRSEHKDSIRDAYEFLGKVEALLNAHQVPEERWYSALLTSLNNYDRQWAVSSLKDLEWNDLGRAFLNHFESPALRDKLIRDLMTIKMKARESVQEYSDRFTSLMTRTGKKDDDETLVAIYIDGLDSKLQELMNVSRASALTTWSRIKDGSPPISITSEIVNAITLDAARKPLRSTSDGSYNTDGDRNPSKSSTAAKRCAKCKSKWHTTEEHKDKPKPTSGESSTTPAASKASTEKQKEKECFKCGHKPWKPGHKCDGPKKPQNNNIQVLESGDEEHPDISRYDDERKLADELMDSIMCDDKPHDNTSINTMTVSDVGPSVGSISYHGQSATAPSDSSELLYTPVIINDRRGWALVDCGATTLFVATHFVVKHELSMSVAQGAIIDGMGQKMAERKGQVAVTVVNGDKTVTSKAEVLDMQQGRDMVIGLDHFTKFGFEVRGVPSFPPKTSNIDEEEEVIKSPMNSEDYDEVDGLTAADLDHEVSAALERNQKLSPSSYCSHPLAVLPLKPIDATPVWRRMNFVSKKDEADVTEVIERWLKVNVIEPAPEDCMNCFPLLAVPKKDSEGRKTGVRPCLDVRLLNTRLPDDDYELPRVQDVIDQTASVKGDNVYYTTIDIVEGFLRFVVPPSDRNWAAFKWQNNHYRFCRAPFGIKIMTARFQRLMDKVFADMHFVAVYVDDIVVYSGSKAEHVEHVKAVINRLTALNVVISVKKSRFGQRKVKLLGFIVSGKGLEMNPAKAEAIANWEKPRTVAQLLRFLGTANFYRQFIRDYSTITAPLDKVRKENGVIKWTEKMEDSFESLKQAMTKRVLLAHPRNDLVFKLGVDASDFGLGAWLAQGEKKEQLRYISFASRSLSKSERNYSATKKELLAIVWALNRFRNYLSARKFTLFTDHRSLIYLFTQKSPSSMMYRWYDTLLEFDYDIVHIAGKHNIIADALSRKSEALSLQALTVQQLYRNKKAPPTEEGRRSEVERAHNFGHFGEQEVFKKLWNKGYWWEGIREDIKKELSNCTPCLRYNIQKRGFHPLRSIVAELPWDHIAVDLVTPLPVSDSGCDTLLVVVDIMTKFAILRCTAGKDMVTIATQLWEILSIFGIPKIIQSDGGSEFVNQLINELTSINGIDHRTISAYNPRANGAAERTNATVETMLKKELNGAMHQWTDFIPYVQLAYNCKIAALTGSTPFSLMFGRSVNDFEKYGRTRTQARSEMSMELWKTRQQRLSEVIYPAVNEHVLTKKSKMQSDFIRTKNIISEDKFPCGAQVMMVDKTRESKWDPVYEGPFTVVRMNRGNAYILRDALGELKRTVPADQLKLVSREGSEAVVEDAETHEVKAIKDHRAEKNGKSSYFVEWKNKNVKPSWVRVEDFDDIQVIRKYWKSVRPTRRSKSPKN